MVEEAVQKAVTAMVERDLQLAALVIASDQIIDDAEVDVEEECLKALALYQPVAKDLRYIVAVLKLNNDLERIADLAVDIAQQVAPLAAENCIPYPVDLMPLASRTQSMLRKALDALADVDCSAAYAVCAADDEVDAMHRDVYAQVKALVRAQPEKASALIHLLSVSRYLERVADLATNIAEDVIYMMEGEIVRHGHGRRSS